MENEVRIEKAKEFFAYEMTEVRLMLEGEFASISRKDMDYSPVEAQKLQFPEFGPVTVITEAVAQVLPMVEQFHPITVKTDITAEAVAAPVMPMIQPIALDLSRCTVSLQANQQELPQAQRLIFPEKVQIQVQPPCITVPPLAASLPAQGAIAVTLPPVDKISVPEAVSFQIVCPAEPLLADPNKLVALPEIQPPQITPCDVAIMPVNPELPTCPTLPEFRPVTVQADVQDTIPLVAQLPDMKTAFSDILKALEC